MYKTPVNCSEETFGKTTPKNVCIVDADESMGIRLDGVPHRYHENHFACKRNKFTRSVQLGTQVYSDGCNAYIFGNTGCKYWHGSWTNYWENLREIDEAWHKGRQSSVCVIDGSLSSQEFGVGTSISNSTKAELYSEVTL